MTERNSITQSHRDTRAALLLLATFAVCLSAPELTDIRRPFHDAVGLFYGRIFMTDAVRNGSIPFWYPYTRYSIPMASLEGGMGWSPIGFLVGAIAQYDLLCWAVEGLLWNLVCVGGTFMFARRHVSSPYSAAAIAMTYASSGLLLGAVPTVGTTRAFQIGPWVFQAIDTLVRPSTWNRLAWARGTTTLAVAGMLWLSSAYPGIWLTAPVLVAPYALLRTRGHFGPIICLSTSVAIATLLALGMCAILVDGTFNAPFFGQVGARPPVSPGDNALQFRALIHTFLANPAYLRDASGSLEPLYMGAAFLPGLLLLFPRWSVGALVLTMAFKRSRTFAVFGWFAVSVAAIAIAIPSMQGIVTGHQNPWLAIWFGLGCIALVSRIVRQVTHIDYALLISTLFSIGLASDNFLGNLFRTYIPPFTFIRWNDWYTWTAILCASTYVWRNIEQWVLSTDWLATKNIVFEDSTRTSLPSIAVTIIGVVSLVIGISTLPRPIPVDYDAIHMLTLFYLSACVPLTAVAVIISAVFAYRERNWGVSLPGLWVGSLILVPVISGMAATSMAPADVQSHRVASAVGLWFHMQWDIIQIVLIPLGVLGLLHIFRRRISDTDRLALIATCVAIDMSLASPRMLSHAAYLRTGQIDRPTLIDREFSFVGNERQPNESTMSAGASLYNAFMKNPDQLKPGGAQPMMEAYDAVGGSPSTFSEFVRFPSHWSSPTPKGFGRISLESVAEVPGQPWLPAGASTISSPACGDTQPGESSGRISKLLPDRVVATIQADCARLVVLMDTWAPGWTVSVDGQPTQPIRVNGVLRGVEVPAGDHTIMWFYRPVHWTLIVSVTVSSLLITIALGVASVALPGRLKVLAS